MKIRDYVPSDRSDCLGVFDSNVPRYFSTDERASFEEYLDRRPGRYVVLCNDEGKVVGCGGLAPSRTDAYAVDLTWGMVHAHWHRHGLGRLLTRERLSWLASMPPQITVVRMNTSHETEGFYERFGFRTVKRIKNGYREGLHRCDMEWSRPSM